MNSYGFTRIEVFSENKFKYFLMEMHHGPYYVAAIASGHRPGPPDKIHCLRVTY